MAARRKNYDKMEIGETFTSLGVSTRAGELIASRFSSLSGALPSQWLGVTAPEILPFLRGFFHPL